MLSSCIKLTSEKRCPLSDSSITISDVWVEFKLAPETVTGIPPLQVHMDTKFHNSKLRVTFKVSTGNTTPKGLGNRRITADQSINQTSFNVCCFHACGSDGFPNIPFLHFSVMYITSHSFMHLHVLCNTLSTPFHPYLYELAETFKKSFISICARGSTLYNVCELF